MKKNTITAIILAAGLMLTACGGDEPVNSPIQTLAPKPVETSNPQDNSSQEESKQEEEIDYTKMYQSELTNEWIDKELKDQRPVAIMVDNEKTALPHYGLTEADIVYEIMNSTKNDRITRFMAIVKDWGSITQFGSIRSTRPTNFMLAAEWNAVLLHDGGPFFIDTWLAKDYTANFSGGFARFSNGKATEFTEYITYDEYTNTDKNKTYDGLKQRFENSHYSTTYNKYYEGPHFQFASEEQDFSGRSDSKAANVIELPFPHNKSTLKYNEETGTYDYSEYGTAHLDPLHDDAQLTFENVILQDTTFSDLGEGYMIYNAIDSGRNGYYITNGQAIEITWTKKDESGLTVYYDKSTGKEIQLNTGKTYISLIPSDTWKQVVIK